jgi:hypothetical protein
MPSFIARGPVKVGLPQGVAIEAGPGQVFAVPEGTELADLLDAGVIEPAPEEPQDESAALGSLDVVRERARLDEMRRSRLELIERLETRRSELRAALEDADVRRELGDGDTPEDAARIEAELADIDRDVRAKRAAIAHIEAEQREFEEVRRRLRRQERLREALELVEQFPEVRMFTWKAAMKLFGALRREEMLASGAAAWNGKPDDDGGPRLTLTTPAYAGLQELHALLTQLLRSGRLDPSPEVQEDGQREEPEESIV